MRRTAFVFALVFAALPAWAASIVGASYVAADDEIAVDIAYLGTEPGHRFAVEWGPCRDDGAAVRLIDRQGDDLAKTEFRVTRRVGLGELACRPTVVTLRLGRVSHVRVYVPALE